VATSDVSASKKQKRCWRIGTIPKGSSVPRAMLLGEREQGAEVDLRSISAAGQSSVTQCTRVPWLCNTWSNPRVPLGQRQWKWNERVDCLPLAFLCLVPALNHEGGGAIALDLSPWNWVSTPRHRRLVIVPPVIAFQRSFFENTTFVTAGKWNIFWCIVGN